MCIIAPARREVEQKSYVLRVVTPTGHALELDYGPLNRIQGCWLAVHMAEVLGRLPIPSDEQPMKDVWLDLAAMGEAPRQCQVYLCHPADASDQNPHGYATALILPAIVPLWARQVRSQPDRQHVQGGVS